VPLLDGKYEILAEHPLGDGVVRFDATTADGHPVRVVWYDLSAADEAPSSATGAPCGASRARASPTCSTWSRARARATWPGARTPTTAPPAPLDAASGAPARGGVGPEHARVRLGPSGPRRRRPALRRSVPEPPRATAGAAATIARRAAACARSRTPRLSWAIAGRWRCSRWRWSPAASPCAANDRLVRVPDPGGADA
jgi:hypothetical protein